MRVPGSQAVPTPRNAAEALAAVHAGLGYLAAADAAGLTVAEQADCLCALERAEAVRIAARSSVLAAFGAAGGYEDDGHGSARSWLRWQARVTGGAAGAATAWSRRLAAHPAVHAALAAGRISPSWAREICDWTDLLPESARDDADVILLAAAAAGAELNDLAGLAEEMRARTAGPDRDRDPQGLDERSLRLDLHWRGAGKLAGDLTPGCAAALQAVLEALGKKTGPEDVRTPAQRDHDALEEACRRLIASRCLPDRAGQPTQIQLIMTLDQLLGLGQSRSGADADWAPAGTGVGLDGTGTQRGGADRTYPNVSCPVPGPLADEGDWCDASIVPVVTGHADHDLLDQLTRDLVPGPVTAARLRDLLLRHAVTLLSGPGGLAARLRTGTLTGPAASISLPLDTGAGTDTIPPHIRRAVILRDQHCGYPGCLVPPAGCQVHHLFPRSQGGTTSVANCALFCAFHHLIAIHQWGWHVTLNPDGTKTAVSPDRTRTLNSHDPPRAA